MKVTNAIATATKKANKEVRYEGHFYRVEYKGWEVSFAPNGNRNDPTIDATNFCTKPASAQERSSGTFHRNLKQCFDFVDQMERYAS